jgi:tetratricopeptide (TPR) repeat protein
MATKAQEVRPARRRWLLPAILAALLLGGAAVGVRAVHRRAVVLSAIPARPDLGALPPEMAGQLDASEQLARSALHSVGGLAELSRLYHANGFYNEAMQCYRALRQLEPGEARWPHLEASILSQFGQQDEAIPREQAAVDLAPGYIPARLRLADELLKADRTADAAQAYSEVLARAPDNPYAQLGLAKCDIKGGGWDRARERLKQAVARNPDFIGGLSTLVTVDEHLGDTAGADALRATIGRREFTDLPDPWLDSLMDDCFDSYRLSVAAAVADFSGNRSGAKQMLERAIAFGPGKSEYHRQLAVMFARDGDLVSARQHLERAVAISPADNDAWLLLSQYLDLLHESGASEQALRSGLANCPLSAGLHLENARRLSRAGRTDEAIEEFREAFRLNPSEADPLVQLAGLLIAASRGEEAVAALKEALEHQPENPAALATLTFYYVTSGDEAGALEWWGHVRRQPRTPPEMVESLRQAFRQRFGRDPN